MPGDGVPPFALHVKANGDALPPPPPVDQPGLKALGQTSPFRFWMLPLGIGVLNSITVAEVQGTPARININKPRFFAFFAVCVQASQTHEYYTCGLMGGVHGDMEPGGCSDMRDRARWWGQCKAGAAASRTFRSSHRASKSTRMAKTVITPPSIWPVSPSEHELIWLGLGLGSRRS